ncbi:zinc finger protein 189-like [Drosophila nasuta]|uniref:zinc finger protein 189-like n=1 Tax=Drosophila nasuta TaxID=42062 RepID=UPI00295EDF52|nr:zinc finger protein 189-like [Drosophila nasuta]
MLTKKKRINRGDELQMLDDQMVISGEEQIDEVIEPFKCDECIKAFATKKGLSNHMRVHNSSAQSQSQLCEVCGEMVKHRRNLAAHMRTHAQHRPNRNCRRRSNTNIAAQIADVEVIEVVFVVTTITTTMVIITTIIKITIEDEAHIEETIEAVVTRTEATIAITKEITFNASEAEEYLDDSMDETSGNVVVSASQQQQATTGNAGGEVLPHVCHVCNKAFRQQCRLNQHLRSHDDEKLYMCEVCGKMLKHLRNYKEHMMKHTNVKQHQCNICERFYHTASSLAAHMRTL